MTAQAATPKRWKRDHEIELIVKSVTLTLTLTGSALTTSEVLDALERAGFEPPALTRSGRLRQLEKALASPQAAAAGISIEPGKFPRVEGRGRPATRRWRLEQPPQPSTRPVRRAEAA